MTDAPSDISPSVKPFDETKSSDEVATQLERLVSEINQAYPDLADPFDPEWRSPCETAAPRMVRGASATQRDESLLEVPWQPLRRPEDAKATLFEPLERALEISVHRDLRTFFGHYYSGGLETNSPEGPVSLLQLWNDDDATRLIENLLGHALAQTRAKTPFSIFFALTEVDSEMFLAVENHTGHVLLERPGYRPERTVAGSLAEFLSSLSPAPPERHPERAAFLRAQSVD